jgi:hypothetical protein
VGYIYVLANDAMPGLLKVGFTERTPSERARELHTTGTPAPFNVVFAVQLEGNVYQIEQRIHRRLRRFRPDRRREFFRIGLDEAVQRIADFVADERHVVINVMGDVPDPFPDAEERAARRRALEMKEAADKRAAENVRREAADRAARAERAAQRERDAAMAMQREREYHLARFRRWKEDNAPIQMSDVILTCMFTFPIGIIAGQLSSTLAQHMGLIHEVLTYSHGRTSKHLEGETLYFFGGWALFVALLIARQMWIRSRTGWGTIIPDEFKDVA